jgi:hypothetical protein
MYNTKKLSKLAEQMANAKSEDRIKELAAQEYLTVEIISDKIIAIALKLQEEGLIGATQSKQIEAFRKNIYFLYFALQDIIQNRSGRPLEDKVSYLQKMITNYEKQVKLLEEDFGEEIKHVRGAVKKLIDDLKAVNELK